MKILTRFSARDAKLINGLLGVLESESDSTREHANLPRA